MFSIDRIRDGGGILFAVCLSKNIIVTRAKKKTSSLNKTNQETGVPIQ